jgi:hypothetical protein
MQNKSFFTRLLVALLGLLPLTASAQNATQLAKWTFDTGYTVTDNVYTPSTNDWAAIGWNGFGTLPCILPNEFNPNRSLGPISSGDVKVFSCSPESKKCLPLIHGSHKT